MSDHRMLYDWFEPSVQKFANHTAIEVGGIALTYSELQSVVHGCAAAILDSCRAQPPRRVGLFSDRSLISYATYLAILRIGATPVPLSLDAPAARTLTIVRAAQLDLVIRTDATPPVTEAPTLIFSIAQLENWQSTQKGSLPASTATADDFAYILFTSGSTGVPKGVPLRHRNLSPFLAHIINQYPAGPSARVSQVADLTFDPSVHDMFVAWATGATLVVPSKREIRAAVEFINERGITHWFSVPTVIALAAQLGDLTPGAMPALKWSLFSGEPLTYALAEKWQRAAPNSTIDNIYGPTELTGCYEYRLPNNIAHWPARTANGTVPIGRDYPDVQSVIIDDNGHRSHIGELCMRGAQRFPGYLDPTQNHGRFLSETADGFWAAPADALLSDEHWYATGDLVTEENSALIHLGRKDHQVKVNGQRVEIGEIEEMLRQQIGVLEAVVVARSIADAGMQLRGAFTGPARDGKEVLKVLRKTLPPHMVPSRLVRLDALPRNANGKTDRNAVSRLLFPSSP